MPVKNLFTAAIALTVVFQAFAQIDPCTQTTPLTGGTRIALPVQGQQIDQLTGAIAGTDFAYELWHNRTLSTNEVSMTLYGADNGGGAAFRGEFNEPNTQFNWLARVGYKLDEGKLFTEYGDMFVDYNYTRSPRLMGGNYSYIGIYGWARPGNEAKLVEWYIVDDWWGNQHQADTDPVGPHTLCSDPNGGAPLCSSLGTLEIDGGIYDIYKSEQINAPSIVGNVTFDQYFSVRRTTRKCGTISITEHFRKWEELGLRLGPLYEAKILAEAGAYTNSTTTGWIDYSYATIRMGGLCAAGTYPLFVTASPLNSGTVVRNSENVCFAPGSQVNVTATANAGWNFTGWSGGATGSANPVTVTTGSAAMNITAIFERDGSEVNLVKDGDFPGSSLPATWSLGTGASSEVSGGKLKINITALGASEHEPQLSQQGIDLVQGQTYILTFNASAAEARKINFMLQQSSGSYTWYGGTEFSLTTQEQPLQFEFEMTHPSDPNAQLAFHLNYGDAAKTASVTISDVRLIQAGTTSIGSTGRTSAQAAQNRDLRVTAKRSAVNVRFNAQNSGTAELRLYNLRGEVVARTSLRTAAGRSYSHNFSTRRIPNGVYIVAVHSGGSVMQSRVAVPK